MANLILTYLNQGRLNEAEELQVYVMKTSEKVLGAEHPDTLISMSNLAILYKDLGRWQEAEDLEMEATEIESRLDQMTVPTDEGSMTEPSYPIEDATQGPFSFGSSGFHINYTCRESVTRLKKLCFPELLKSEKARKSAQNDASMIDRPWIRAQLQHYGIDFSPDIDPFKAKALLLTSVAQGLCDTIPPQVLKIKATLKEAYQGEMDAYRDNMKAYRAQELPKRIQKFEACTTPTEEAGCDASLFLRKYFLDEKGNSDRTKTPELVLLPGYIDKGMALTGRTERIPALHVAYGGLGGADNVTVVGWNRARVNDKAHQIDLRQPSGRGILRSDQNWDRQMMSHHEYVEKLRSRSDNLDPKSGSSFETHHITGKYVVNCEAIQHDCSVLSKQLRLRFYRSGRLAIFDLGIVVGLMVLGKTQQDVTKLLEDGSWDTDPCDEEDSDDENEREDVSSDEEKSDAERASGCSEDSDHNSGDESDTPIHLTIHQPPKRQEIESSHPRRVYFQWRGYNTVSGAIQFDPQNRNTGYLDFVNDDATSFEGNILMEATMRSAISFQGYRVPGLTGPLTMNWNAFSHLASERAKVPEHMW
ncbi:hypothetical protein HO133_003348 [Letharia lupina]|uniref:Uncharacterized protein n=1 Tax=Letharia lupina TaxID=560253 RepID=A0A8H6CBH3_9LECA|nr:uncharacterized protein HO133_003348 [Letharia lupina]KAF6220216.1 hypothetical protein HO133_003348 [Letharia lupina]